MGWPDAEILRHAGLRVQTFPQLDSLFHSLEADTGLRKTFANGRAQQLLMSDPGYAEALKRGAGALKLRIDNPDLSAEFRAMPAAYFLR